MDWDLWGEMERIQNRLRAAGIRATTDPKDLNPPGVLIRSPNLTFQFQKGRWVADWELWAVVPDSGSPSTYRNVTTLLADVTAALDWGIQTGRPTDVALADGSTVPGYVLAYQTNIHPSPPEE